MKRLIVGLLTFFLATSFLGGQGVQAVAKAQTSGDLQVSYDDPFLSSGNIWYPGFSLTQPLTVKNLGTAPHTVSIRSSNETDNGTLSEMLFFRIDENGNNRYGGSSQTLKDFWNAGETDLSTLGSGISTNYDFTVTMDNQAGNSSQGQSAKFDLLIGFVGTNDQVAVTAGGGGGGGGGPFAAPVCSDTKPGSPTNFAASNLGTGKIALSWTAPAQPYTYFLVAYSDSSDWPPKWGNPNVGNVDSYIVSGLGSGTYWFWVRAGNGCAPGDFVGPVSPGAIAGIVEALAVAPGFAPGVLGTSSPAAQPASENNLLGVAVAVSPSWWESFWWIFPLFILLVFILWFYLKRKRRRH